MCECTRHIARLHVTVRDTLITRLSSLLSFIFPPNVDGVGGDSGHEFSDLAFNVVHARREVRAESKERRSATPRAEKGKYTL